MKRVLLIGMLGLGPLLAGCGGSSAYVVRYGPPPPPRHGFVGSAPAPGYVWTQGYWDRRGGQWAWVEGRWVMPPHPHAVWVAPVWRHEHGNWRYYAGHWRR